VTIVSDEVFWGIWLQDEARAESVGVKNPEAIVIGSLSKAFGMGGLRIGWLVGPSDLIRRCKEWRYYTTNSPPVLVQQVATIVLEKRAAILCRNETIARNNLEFAVGWLTEHRDTFDWLCPRAGLAMLIRLKPQVNTSSFVRDLAKHSKVLLIPCTTCFGMSEGHLRLGLGAEPKYFRDGLEKLHRYLATRRWRNSAVVRKLHHSFSQTLKP
jgi:aspartate/methionine/tyrosine aminotransferase